MENNYNTSFFKPSSEFSRKNRNLVLVLVIIWAIGVFGFQILLKIVEKPTPEEALIEFNQVKQSVLYGNEASKADVQLFLKTLINVANKNTLHKEKERPTIYDAINWATYSLVSDKDLLKDKLAAVNEGKVNKEKVTDLEQYKKEVLNVKSLQTDFMNTFSTELAINPNDIRGEILVSVLSNNSDVIITDVEKEQLPAIMDKYLIHNRSFLTDTTFIGFPFHYFYTAVFLLIMFVVLCYIYAMQIQRLNKRFGIVE